VTIDVETEGGILKLNYVKGNDPNDTAVEFIKVCRFL
jgi:hypothetical protein